LVVAVLEATEKTQLIMAAEAEAEEFCLET
jgi:hypothetical protein